MSLLAMKSDNSKRGAQSFDLPWNRVNKSPRRLRDMTDAAGRRLGLWWRLYSHGLQGALCHFHAKTYKQRICLERAKASLECIYFTSFPRTTYNIQHTTYVWMLLLLSFLGCCCIPFSALCCKNVLIADLLRRLLWLSTLLCLSKCIRGRRR